MYILREKHKNYDKYNFFLCIKVLFRKAQKAKWHVIFTFKSEALNLLIFFFVLQIRAYQLTSMISMRILRFYLHLRFNQIIFYSVPSLFIFWMEVRRHFDHDENKRHFGVLPVLKLDYFCKWVDKLSLRSFIKIFY